MLHHLYHVLYKTTCQSTGHYYVGMHSTNKLKDRYLGSGRKLLASIRRYGREDHKIEVLELCKTREELLEREKEIINDEMLSDSQCMNLVRGGNTMPHEYNRNPNSAKLQAESLKKYFQNLENRQRLSDAVKQSYKQFETRARVSKKLTEHQVLEIHKLFAEGLTYRELATKFNVSGNTIWMIVTKRTWKHVL